MKTFEIESHVGLSPQRAWEIVTTPAGVNREFWPLLRMTFPRGADSLVSAWQPGRTLFRSWILLFGLLPVEYDDIAFVEVEEGRRFLERSEMLTQSLWQHERTIFADANGCRIADRVAFASRIPALEPLQGMIFRAVFRYRHFRLRRLYPIEMSP